MRRMAWMSKGGRSGTGRCRSAWNRGWVTRSLGGALALALVASAAVGQTVDLNALDAYFAKAREDWQVPGIAVAIVKDDELIFA